MEFYGGHFVLTLLDNPTYSPESADNLRAYDHEYSFAENYHPSSTYGVVCRGSLQQESSCALLAAGGATRVNRNSAVIVGERCFVGIGDSICSLAFPGLQLEWARRVDSATCFGVYHVPAHDCLISHGELEIARLNLSGDIVWSSGGRDIFSEGFRLFGGVVEAVDFQHYVYHFDIATGQSSSMTEQEWLDCIEPGPLLEFMTGIVSERKQLLVAAACFRHLAHLLPDPRQLQGIELLEKMADGTASPEAGRQVTRGVRLALPANREIPGGAGIDDPYYVALMLYRALNRSAAGHAIQAADGKQEQKHQACLFREIVGNPFRPMKVDPAWLTWNDGTVVTLAQAIYDERRFADLPILADALQESGCTNLDFLAHCRQGGKHVRGCCAVDLLLGRE
jgi:hypothetical protein